ncbi:pentachlorophenol monooxygenase/3-(3-hydroxy-phenyl)propionate hydroxylase [Pseudonocardia hierapolitana]|uniref:Pentachlorophenol monooxygenase/3-(3-hydroxy-phenyl)propionate hydroxylase n=1 Tax=Pseudonocardia hierapolitana TaxID=1128676 RepID=A0A561SP38_9PSEU|nr:pentachlorophenol monooxygenase/3-(3-hydroxy-phenyl)propionate hydroxylase [Pseudonocardia hierapolitana]
MTAQQNTTEFPVIISGGGPVGMATALLLARQGARSVVLERNTSTHCGQSRAITVQRDILALFDRLGIVNEILDGGASWSLGRTYYRDQEILRLRWPARGEEVYPAFVNFPQFRIEELLHAETARSGLVEFRHGRTVVGLRQGAASVIVEAEGPAGQERYTGAYLVGADGIGSTTREALRIPFDGWPAEGRFLVADFEVDLPLAVERRLWFDPPFSPGGIVLMHCMGKRTWRIDWQIDADVDEGAVLRPERLGERVRNVIGDRPFAVLRANTYTFQQRRARRFREGRVFLAGDSAHVVSPFGARGMNSGLEDAENLAWKLGFVLTGQVDPALLDTYELERIRAADHHIQVTGETMRFMTPADAEGKARRDAVLEAAAADPTRSDRIDSGKLYEPHPYTASPLTLDLEVDGSPRSARPEDPTRAGVPAPDGFCQVSGSSGRTTLRKALGGAVSLLVAPAEGGAGHDLAQRLARVPTPTGVRRHLLTRPGTTTQVPRGVDVISDSTGALVRAYTGPRDRLYLVRPDCYIAVRIELAAPDALAGAAERALDILMPRMQRIQR